MRQVDFLSWPIVWIGTCSGRLLRRALLFQQDTECLPVHGSQTELISIVTLDSLLLFGYYTQ